MEGSFTDLWQIMKAEATGSLMQIKFRRATRSKSRLLRPSVHAGNVAIDRATRSKSRRLPVVENSEIVGIIVRAFSCVVRRKSQTA
jgi:hypothetical protein